MIVLNKNKYYIITPYEYEFLLRGNAILMQVIEEIGEESIARMSNKTKGELEVEVAMDNTRTITIE